MMKKVFPTCWLALAVALGVTFCFTAGALAEAPKPNPYLTKKCMNCHKDVAKEENVLTGEFQSLSNKAKSFQVQVNDEMQIVKFTDDTDVDNVESIKKLKKPIPVKVYFEMKDGDLVATHIVAKPVIKVPENQLVDVPTMEKYVAEGPEKGNFVLVDARPPVAFQEGHIPGAISIPFPKLLDLAPKLLPKEKDKLIIFYCGGFR